MLLYDTLYYYTLLCYCVIYLFLDFRLLRVLYYEIQYSAYTAIGVKSLELFLQYRVYRSKFRLDWNREQIRHWKACHKK